MEEFIGKSIEYILTADDQYEAFLEVSKQMQSKGMLVYLHFISQYARAMDDVRTVCTK